MKALYVLLGCVLGSNLVFGQQITTPSGSPLLIGNNGVRFSSLNSSSSPQTANGLALSVNSNGDIILVPASAGGSSSWNASGSNLVNSNAGNVGIGVASPAYKLDVSGAVNASQGFAVGGISMLRYPGNYNLFLGEGAGNLSFTAASKFNTAIGRNAGTGLTSGEGNFFIGYNAGRVNDTGSFNFIIGNEAGFSNTSGLGNVFLGPQAGYFNTSGRYNMFLGQNAGYKNSSGNDNIALGVEALRENLTGTRNVAIGASSGFSTVGSQNVFIGKDAAYQNSTGSNNVMLGTEVGYRINSDENVLLGYLAGYNIVSGGMTTAVGSRAGAADMSLGVRNTFLGYDANAATAGLTNITVIGAGARVTASNSVILGSNANVGIGVTAPSAKLEVKSGTPGSSGLKFTDLTSASTGTIVTATRFLTVDANGNVVLGNAGGAREAASFAENWKLDAVTKSLSNSNEGAVVIGQNLLKTPGSYRLFVQEGILTERVKVALRNTDDWSDKVFAPTYKLRSLNEVEQFIKENNHLPGVPSATEMVNSGNDLHKTDAVLLEKVEELTLYMLQLKKENEKLRNEVDELKKTLKR